MRDVNNFKSKRPSHREQGRSVRTHTTRKPTRIRHRPLRCDCGKLAITVLTLKVGIDPQYTVHLPLCPDCLALEQEGKVADG